MKINKHNLATMVWQDPACFIAFGFGSGLLPKAPGTWGTLAALPVYLLIAPYSITIYLIITLILFLLGVWVCDNASTKLGVHDYKGIVWDEVVGYLITMTTVPVGIGWMLAGFILFRLFDIVKPFPISIIDKRIKGGFGIMLDDLVAGVFAGFILQLFYWMFAS